jgi:hypothetical protein
MVVHLRADILDVMVADLGKAICLVVAGSYCNNRLDGVGLVLLLL